MEIEKVGISKRNNNIDIMRGIAIVLMVLGHTHNSIIWNFIYCFHLAAFFMISGYCFNDKYTDSFRSLCKLILKRIKTLWIPYVVWNFIFLILQNPFIRIGILTDNPEYFSLNPMGPQGFSNYLSFKEMVIVFIKSLFFLKSRPLIGASWFLGGLFFVTVFFACFEYVLKKIKIQKLHSFFSILFVILGYILTKKFNAINNSIMKYLCIVLFGDAVFLLGKYIKEKELLFINNINKFIGFIICTIILFILQFFGYVNYSTLQIVNPVFYFIASISGFYWLFYFSQILDINKRCRNLFISFGVHTVPIIILHELMFKIITLIQISIYNVPIVYLSLFPVWKNEILWAIAYLIVGLFFSWGVALLLSKNKYLKTILKA